MLSLQRSLFTGKTEAPQGLKYLAGGCYSNVYTVHNRPDMVVKSCSSQDGTLAWLMWCVRNQGRKGVPIIESLVLAEGGYLCTMRRYESMQSGAPHSLCGKPEYQIEGTYWRNRYDVTGNRVELHGPGAPNEFDIYGEPGLLPQFSYLIDLEAEFGAQTGLEWDDVHHGNYMWCTETQTIVVTDPSGGGCDIDDVASRLDEHSLGFAFELTMQ